MLCKLGFHRLICVRAAPHACLTCERCGVSFVYSRVFAALSCLFFGHTRDDSPNFMEPCRCCGKFIS